MREALTTAAAFGQIEIKEEKALNILKPFLLKMSTLMLITNNILNTHKQFSFI
jgi:hypothetical protein